MTGALFVSGSSFATDTSPQAAGVAPATAEPDAEEMLQSLQASSSDGLQTPFELSNGAEWTTVQEAQRFRRQLARSSDRVSVQNVGRSVEGRPIQLVTVGYPEPKPMAEAAEGSMVLFNCSIHGNEESGREACMTLARDLSTTEDPAWKRLLSNTTVAFTTINPDGWEADTRGNANGVDINRDFLALETPEAQTLAKIIRDWKPDVLNDLHEYGPREYYNTDALVLWPRNRNVDDVIYRLATRHVNEYTAPQIEADGLSVGIYGLLVKDGEPFQQVAGDEQARILRNYAGLRHVVGQLTEAASGPLTPEEEADQSLENRRAVLVQYNSAVGSMHMALENRRQLARQTAAAAERATEEGAERSGVVYFAGQDNMIPTGRNDVEPNPMCGYQLTREQRHDLRRTLNLHGITWENNREGAFVPMAQPAEPLIPLLLDERANYNIAEAEAVYDC